MPTTDNGWTEIIGAEKPLCFRMVDRPLSIIGPGTGAPACTMILGHVGKCGESWRLVPYIQCVGCWDRLSGHPGPHVPLNPTFKGQEIVPTTRTKPLAVRNNIILEQALAERVFRFIAQLNLQDHPVKEQREQLELVRQFGAAIRTEKRLLRIEDKPLLKPVPTKQSFPYKMLFPTTTIPPGQAVTVEAQPDTDIMAWRMGGQFIVEDRADNNDALEITCIFVGQKSQRPSNAAPTRCEYFRKNILSSGMKWDTWARGMNLCVSVRNPTDKPLEFSAYAEGKAVH